MGAIFGRACELSALDEAAARTLRDGRVTAVLVEGDPGSGKTRLLKEFLRELPDGRPVTVGCYEPERRLPLSVGRSLAMALSRRPEAGQQILAAFDAGAAVTSLEADLSEAVHRAVSLSTPVTVVVDDVQWCDEESTALLHYVTRGADEQDDALVLILAGRPSPVVTALAVSLEHLLGERLVHLPLAPLAHDDAVALVRSLDSGLSRDDADELATRARGSPFWCTWLASAAGDGRRTPDVVADRLRTSSPDAATVLATATLFGRPVGTLDVAEIHGWAEDRVQGAVGELAGAGLLVQDGTAIRLAHDLVRTACATRLLREERTHELIAVWLEERAGNADELLAAARHRREAGLATAATLQRILGSPTRRRIGSDGLHAIVAMVDEVPPDDRSAVALGRGVASLAGELGQHTVALARWSSVADRLADPTDRARAWLAASEAARQLERADEARAHLRTARRVAPEDSLLSIELDTVEARLLRWLEHDLDASHELTTAALERARTLASSTRGAPEPELRDAHLAALVLACVDAMQRDATDEILALADEIGDVAAGSDTRASVQARLRSGSALMLAGRLEAAESSLAGAWSDARRSFLADLTLDVGSWLTWTRYLMGRLVEAEEVASECRALATRLGERTRPATMAERWCRIIEISRGDRGGALDALRIMVTGEADPHHRLGIRQVLATWLSRLDAEATAQEVLEHLTTGRSESEQAGCTRCQTEFLLTGVEALARLGEQGQADRWMQTGRVGAGSGQPHEWLLARAEASIAMAGPDADPGPLEHAIALADRRGLQLEAVWARLDLGFLLSDVRPDRAVGLLREAASAAERSGAGTEARVAAHLLRRAGVRTWHRSAEPSDDPLAGLSPREQEIAAMVAEGASNLDIAHRLFLSRKTIERHVSNIFVKLGVRNRAQLAAAVAVRGSRARPSS